jgi:hypothetical protein
VDFEVSVANLRSTNQQQQNSLSVARHGIQSNKHETKASNLTHGPGVGVGCLGSMQVSVFVAF